jgi:hypothetical protein
MFDCFLTLFSLGAVAWFVVIAPALRRVRQYIQEREERADNGLPAPRYPPVQDRRTEQDRFDSIIAELASFSKEPVHVPGTDTQTIPPGTPGTPDTNGKNQGYQGYQEVKELVQQGYSGNQIAGIVGGKRAAVLDQVRQARRELGI